MELWLGKWSRAALKRLKRFSRIQTIPAQIQNAKGVGLVE